MGCSARIRRIPYRPGSSAASPNQSSFSRGYSKRSVPRVPFTSTQKSQGRRAQVRASSKVPGGPSREANEGRRRLVDLDSATAPLAGEGRGLRAHLLDLADDPEREIDGVRPEIGDRRPAHAPLEAPVERDLGVEELVREPGCAPEQDLADPPLVDEALEEGDRRQPPVVEADRVGHACRPDGLGPPLRRRHSRPRAASRTGSPCRRRLRRSTTSAWAPGGVQMSTMSMSGRCTSSAQSVVQSSDSVRPRGPFDGDGVASADGAEARPDGQLAHDAGATV